MGWFRAKISGVDSVDFYSMRASYHGFILGASTMTLNPDSLRAGHKHLFKLT